MELVDGQQRLTTLYLIFQYMHTKACRTRTDYSMRYETRADSAAYLEELDPERARTTSTSSTSTRRTGASRLVREPRRRRQYVADKFYGALFEHVHVIWYEAPDELDATTLFTRLNVGRIPLTDAELVKALLLSRSRGKTGGTDRAHAIAAQWDTIERDLREPEVWAFITGKATDEPTHISLLLDTHRGGPRVGTGPSSTRSRHFDNGSSTNPQRFWDRVVGLHALVQGWHENRDLFHKIGFLIAQGDRSTLSQAGPKRSRRKSQFEAELNAADQRSNLSSPRPTYGR